MQTPLQSILRQATRPNNKPLNILCLAVHEAFETSLCQTGHNFYSCWFDGNKRWQPYRKIPSNYHILPDRELPKYIDIDLVLSGNKFDQFSRLQPIAKQIGVSFINVEHTIPYPNWDKSVLVKMNNMRADFNIFISEFQIDEWKWEDKGDTRVIHHGIDTELFKPKDIKKRNQILTVANDYINRDWCLDFQLYQNITKNLPTLPIGDTSGFSKAANSVEELVGYYQSSSIFLCTANRSPISTSLLEAAACGCGIVSVAKCMVPEIFTHGHDALLSNNPKELRQHLELLLQKPELALELGKNARETILDKFSLSRFVSQWNEIFEEAVNTPFRG